MSLGRWRAFAIALAIVTIALLAFRQLGDGHAPHPNYRAQVDAFLDGRLALSTHPDALAHDLAWTDSGVQQVWGLGVPAWQTPFELVGRALGWTPFPDRVALVAFLALALFVAMRGFVRERWLGAGSVLLLAGLPAFVTLLRGRLGVYEEAAAYSYAAAVMLVGGLAAFARAPRATTYLVLVALAGLGGLIRPTVWFYGLATFVVATWLWLATLRPDRARIAALGLALFVGGGGLLYATNARRFGDGMEFGHRLNIHSLPGNIVATRFSYPFERESVVEAATELGGSLFDSPERASVRGKGFYQTGLHLGQQGTPRWREYYFTTYRWLYAPLLAIGFVLAIAAWRRRGSSPTTTHWLGVWSLLGLVPLVAFYLRSPSLSSRYQLDLGPAFAVLLVIAWQTVAVRVRRPQLAFAVLGASWLAAIATSKPNSTRAARTVDAAEAAGAVQRITTPITFERALPDEYTLDDVALYTDVVPGFERCRDATGRAIDCSSPPAIGDVHVIASRDELGWFVVESVVEPAPFVMGCPVELELPDTAIACEAPIAAAATTTSIRQEPPALYLNGVGWDLATGRVPPATHFYVESPQFVELELVFEPVKASWDLASSSYSTPPLEWETSARVAVGLEHLHFVAGRSTADGARLRFEPRAPLGPGLHVAFVAFGPDHFLDRPESDFRLRSIRWR